MRSRRLSLATLCAFAPLLLSCASPNEPVQAGTPPSAAVVAKFDAMNRAMAALPRACSLGNAREVNGRWVGTTAPQSERGAQLVQVYPLSTAVRTNVFHVSMDRQGWQLLDKIEVRDTDGNWRTVWTGDKSLAPASCDFVRLQHGFADAAQVAAVRLVFRREPVAFVAGGVAVLQV